eukprot:CAMPEP_0202363148 /NCGR_PEP_ID=MMETSP1126-20121109/15057_1 /ASSEMBLY_ACC=CAM_ASM_000457 /TAXON_ID=3047 /ORGANISM="Dunaliella tertiolecta, Strain CCMP1320" /LENGTH=180 /DNA_ID=CAMNT_0048957503 /DNA_START=538 /DNA_END=1083 /DNA_ORIENTATION=-
MRIAFPAAAAAGAAVCLRAAPYLEEQKQKAEAPPSELASAQYLRRSYSLPPNPFLSHRDHAPAPAPCPCPGHRAWAAGSRAPCHGRAHACSRALAHAPSLAPCHGHSLVHAFLAPAPAPFPCHARALVLSLLLVLSGLHQQRERRKLGGAEVPAAACPVLSKQLCIALTDGLPPQVLLAF